MLEDGLLVREEVRAGSQVRKCYTATPAGRELYHELVEEAGEAEQDRGDESE